MLRHLPTKWYVGLPRIFICNLPCQKLLTRVPATGPAGRPGPCHSRVSPHSEVVPMKLRCVSNYVRRDKQPQPHYRPKCVWKVAVRPHLLIYYLFQLACAPSWPHQLQLQGDHGTARSLRKMRHVLALVASGAEPIPSISALFFLEQGFMGDVPSPTSPLLVHA